MLVSSDVTDDLAAGDTGKERHRQSDNGVFRAPQPLFFSSGYTAAFPRSLFFTRGQSSTGSGVYLVIRLLNALPKGWLTRVRRFCVSPLSYCNFQNNPHINLWANDGSSR